MKFLCDTMLGTLCKYLRICGWDAAYPAERKKILLQARLENRVLLTRSTRLKDKPGVFFLTADNFHEQFRSIMEKYRLAKPAHYLTRCLICNEPLQPVHRAKVRGRVPYYTFTKFRNFRACPRCRKVYWRGSHYENMVNRIKQLIGQP